MESERKILEEKNKFLRIFPKDKANYSKEEQEENQRIVGYFEYLEKGHNEMTDEHKNAEALEQEQNSLQDV